jgi:hypothetical protein
VGAGAGVVWTGAGVVWTGAGVVWTGAGGAAGADDRLARDGRACAEATATPLVTGCLLAFGPRGAMGWTEMVVRAGVMYMPGEVLPAGVPLPPQAAMPMTIRAMTMALPILIPTPRFVSPSLQVKTQCAC